LKKQHEEQVKRLKASPKNFFTDKLSKLNKTVSNANISVDEIFRNESRVKINIHLREHLNFIEMVFVKLIFRHSPKQLRQLSNRQLGIYFSLNFLFLGLGRKQRLVIGRGYISF